MPSRHQVFLGTSMADSYHSARMDPTRLVTFIDLQLRPHRGASYAIVIELKITAMPEPVPLRPNATMPCARKPLQLLQVLEEPKNSKPRSNVLSGAPRYDGSTRRKCCRLLLRGTYAVAPRCYWIERRTIWRTRTLKTTSLQCS